MVRRYYDHECDFHDDFDIAFADPGGRSALRAASKRNPRNLPCPTCGASQTIICAAAEIERLTSLLAESCEANKNLAIENITIASENADLKEQVAERTNMVEEAFRAGYAANDACGFADDEDLRKSSEEKWQSYAIRKRLMEEMVEAAYREGMIRGISIYAGEFTESRFETAWPYSAIRKRLMEEK